MRSTSRLLSTEQVTGQRSQDDLWASPNLTHPSHALCGFSLHPCNGLPAAAECRQKQYSSTALPPSLPPPSSLPPSSKLVSSPPRHRASHSHPLPVAACCQSRRTTSGRGEARDYRNTILNNNTRRRASLAGPSPREGLTLRLIDRLRRHVHTTTDTTPCCHAVILHRHWQQQLVTSGPRGAVNNNKYSTC